MLICNLPRLIPNPSEGKLVAQMSSNNQLAQYLLQPPKPADVSFLSTLEIICLDVRQAFPHPVNFLFDS